MVDLLFINHQCCSGGVVSRVQRRHSARRMRFCWLSMPFQCLDVRRGCVSLFLYQGCGETSCAFGPRRSSGCASKVAAVALRLSNKAVGSAVCVWVDQALAFTYGSS